MEIKAKEEILLKFIYDHNLVTAEQVGLYHHYSDNSRKYVSMTLNEMVEKSLLLRTQRDHVSQPYFYGVSKNGFKHLEHIGYAYYRVSFKAPLHFSWGWLEHERTANDLFIAAEHVNCRDSRIEVIESRHSWLMKKQIKDIVPDGWVRFGMPSNVTSTLWLEADRATERREAFTNKIKSIIRFLTYNYDSQFPHSNFLQVVFATVGNQARLDNMIAWTEKELLVEMEQKKGDYFKFGIIPDGKIEPDIFCTPYWRVPYRDKLATLLEY